MDLKGNETESIPELQGLLPTGARSVFTGEEHHLAPGARLGRYLILYRVGAGGMGEVYAAFDPQLDRKVAIKIARGEVGSEAVRLRQRREGQALARLRHPNVVTVHDVGEHAGRLFLAMEFVDGSTLGEWLGEARPWRRIVELFLQAGRGLAAIHAAGLVHQDFKPSNAMLGSDGVVRIVDFGLARGQDMVPASGGERSQLHGTPGYLAPERLAGRPSDARSDQYSFCVALWRALHGRPPGELGDDGAGVPGWLRQALRRGLEAKPEDRFPVMEELLDALSPERRLTRRRRWTVFAGALGAAALSIGYLAWQPPPAPLCADAEAYLQGVWDDARRSAVRSAFVHAGDFGAAALPTLEQTLDAYAQDWVTMRSEACEATHVRGEQSQQLLDLRMICLDDRLAGLRALTGVLLDADRESMIQAVPAAMRLRGLDDCADRPELVLLNTPQLDEVGRAEADRIRAAIEEQIALYETGQEDETSIARVEELLEAIEHLGGYPSLEARAARLLGNLQSELSEPGNAERAYVRSLVAAVEAGERTEQARILGRLAEHVGYGQQRFEEARRWARLAEATLAALGPGHEETRVNVLHSLGFLAWSTGDNEQAEKHYRRALEIGETYWDPESPRLITLLSDFAIALGQEGVRIEGDDERTALLERALRIGEEAYGSTAPLLIPTLVNLATNYGIRGRYQEALALAGRSLEIAESYYQENSGLGYPLLVITEVLILLDRPGEARAYGERALTVIAQSFGEAHPLFAEALHALGEIELLELAPAAGWAHFERARRIREDLPAGHPEHAMTHLGLGEAQVALARYERARTALQHARDLAGEQLPYRVHLAIHLRLGEALLGLGRPWEARPFIEHAVDLAIPEADSVVLGEARFLLARAREGDDREAASGLAVAAREGLAQGESPRSRALLRQVDAWLAGPSR